MLTRLVFVLCIVIAAIAVIFNTSAIPQGMNFGGGNDTEFATSLWNSISDYPDWPFTTDLMDAESPHGQFVRSFYNIVTMDDRIYYVIVKDGYGDGNSSRQSVMDSPSENIVSIAVMVQRQQGYDSDAENWYWVRYDNRDGTVTKTAGGTAMAGRVTACINCHRNAGGGDLFFTNDDL